MNGYLFSLAAACVLIALICAIVPTQGLPYVKLLCSLCIVCLVCAPVATLIRELGSGEWEIPEEWFLPDSEDVEQDYEQMADGMLAGQLQVLLEQQFGLDPTCCRIYVEWSGQNRVEAVTLVLSGKAIWQDPDPIKEYVQGLLGCQCTVVLD